MSTIIRFTCPSCEQPIEAPEADALAGIACPGCGTRFVPNIEHKPTLGMKMAGPDYDQFRRVERIEIRADQLSNASVVCFAIMLITFIVTVWVGLSSENISMTACSVAAGFLMLGLWLQLLTQLMRIRALLEKRK